MGVSFSNFVFFHALGNRRYRLRLWLLAGRLNDAGRGIARLTA